MNRETSSGTLSTLSMCGRTFLMPFGSRACTSRDLHHLTAKQASLTAAAAAALSLTHSTLLTATASHHPHHQNISRLIITTCLHKRLVSLYQKKTTKTICVALPSVMGARWVGQCRHLANATDLLTLRTPVLLLAVSGPKYTKLHLSMQECP